MHHGVRSRELFKANISNRALELILAKIKNLILYINYIYKFRPFILLFSLFMSRIIVNFKHTDRSLLIMGVLGFS